MAARSTWSVIRFGMKDNKLLALALLSLLLFSGCFGSERAKKIHAMLQFGILYHEFHADHRRGPSELKELRDHKRWNQQSEAENAMLNSVFDLVEKGEIIVIWNGDYSGDYTENHKRVMAYEKDVPTSGGLIIDGGAGCRKVTAEEFANLEMIKTLPKSTD